MTLGWAKLILKLTRTLAFLFVCFLETGSHVAHCGLELAVLPGFELEHLLLLASPSKMLGLQAYVTMPD